MIYLGINPGSEYSGIASFWPDKNEVFFHDSHVSNFWDPLYKNEAIKPFLGKSNPSGFPMVDKFTVAYFLDRILEEESHIPLQMRMSWEIEANNNGIDFFKITFKDIYQRLLKPNKVGDKVPDIRGYLDRRFEDIGKRNYFQLRALIAAVCCSDMVKSGELKLRWAR